jgi:hypothetical protein
MPRPVFSTLWVALDTLKTLFRVFNMNRIEWALTIVVVIGVLAIIFSFLTFAPVLSPFVYPLF